MKIIRFENSVYFANREYFVNIIYHKSGCNPKDLAIEQKKALKRQTKAQIHTAEDLAIKVVCYSFFLNNVIFVEAHSSSS